ncbi:MAG: Tryptophan halogenase [Rhodobacteraceae bacterium]|uniref:tryptophan halogenase family protein n=1 Tax=Cypionkella sp. TaxID=2811411 RepID=UPI00132075C3|nr:tryptophan halogenase family protein [Cypionkella sp.]KAF0173373.1 MAG: Tryptophan halogenase [Paracoccaceae bacterium]MDO8325868.1 tryptophan 7-halogenase [Cypionkella sp.]
MWPRRIVIVGGGTAGWLAALMLGDSARRGGHACEITVVESSKIGTIGVGEGTTAVFRQMLHHFQIDEMEFLAATGATIKYGIRHKDWRRLGHHYDGPIDDPHRVAGQPGQPNFLDQYLVSQGKPVGESHLFQHLITHNRAPYARQGGKLVAAGPHHHAFHFDQALAGKFLRSKARGVTVLDDQVTSLHRHPDTGDLTAIGLEGGKTLHADFFIDCTGFRRRLIGEMGASWTSYGDILPVNRAMPFWVDLKPGEEIAPVTLAWAQKNGWLWKIPTSERYGMGYVYSDAHTTPDTAKAEIEAALGHEIHPRNDIRIDAGRLAQNWVGNCVALGLSSSFLEPLEATSIHGTVVQLMLLTSLLPDPNPRGRDAYNAACATQVDDFRDFIRLHYVSERRDSRFWQDVASSHPPAVTDRLADWASRVPGPADFKPFPMGLPHVSHELHVPVLDGLGLLSPARAKAWLAGRPTLRSLARKTTLASHKDHLQAANRCLPHRAFLVSLQKEPTA